VTRLADIEDELRKTRQELAAIREKQEALRKKGVGMLTFVQTCEELHERAMDKIERIHILRVDREREIQGSRSARFYERPVRRRYVT